MADNSKTDFNHLATVLVETSLKVTYETITLEHSRS